MRYIVNVFLDSAKVCHSRMSFLAISSVIQPTGSEASDRPGILLVKRNGEKSLSPPHALRANRDEILQGLIQTNLRLRKYDQGSSFSSAADP